MCDTCTTINKYGRALSALHHGLVKVIRAGAETKAITGGAGEVTALASTFAAMALSSHPERESKGMVAFIDSLTPDEKVAARDLSAALGMLYSGNAEIIDAALRAQSDTRAWPEDHANCLDDFSPPADSTKGQILMGMPGDAPTDPDTVAKVKAILAEAARKVAEVTGAPVEMQELHTDGGKIRAGNRSVTAPGQLPMIAPKGPRLVH